MRISDWSSDVCSSDLEFEVGVAAAEQARIDLLHARVDPVEGVLEAAAGLAVDLADRVLQRVQRGGEVGVLGVEVFLALRGLGVLGDRGQDPKSTRLNSVTNAHLVCRLLLEKKNK